MKQLLTIKECSSILNLNDRTVLKLINNGFINSIRIGRTHRVNPKELEKFMNSANEDSIIYEMK